MFSENKYKKWYDMIIENAKNRRLTGYKERHHIIPKSLGGNNELTNLVDLTAREHFICHRLLPRFVIGTFYKKKMLNALGKFIQENSKQQRHLTSKQYEVARKAISEANRNRVYTKEMREKMSLAQLGRTPWNKGKVGVQVYPKEAKEKLKELYVNKSFNERYTEERAESIRQKISSTKIGHKTGMTGKTHSKETKIQMSTNMKGTCGPQQRVAQCPTCLDKNVSYRHITFCGRKD